MVGIDELRGLIGGGDETTSDWVAVDLISAELNAPGFWETQWEPWRLREMAHSRVALRAIQDVSTEALRACEGIAGAYAPDAELSSSWSDRLQWMEPLGPCGRCPGCRASGADVHVDPPPRPRQNWATAIEISDELRSFAISARGQHGLVVLMERPGEDLGDALAAALIGHGVLHVAGEFAVLPSPPLGAALFRDSAPLSPANLAPVSSFSRFGPADLLSRGWLSRRSRPRQDLAGHDLADVLLVPEGARIGGQDVGRDVPAMLAATALELLRKG